MSDLAALTDSWFLPRGLQREPVPGGVNYCGTLDGRAVQAHVSRRSRTKYAGEIRRSEYIGHQIEITMDTPLQTRLSLAPHTTAGAGLAKQVNRWAGAFPVEAVPPELSHLAVWAATPDWAADLLAVPGVADGVVRLLPPASPASSAGVRLTPGQVIFSLRVDLSVVPPDPARGWITDLLALARSAEALPAPPAQELNRLERMTRENPSRAAFKLIAGLGCGLILLGLLFSLGLILLAR